MFKILVIVFCMFVYDTAFAECPSEATLHVKSSTYSGKYNIELRSGTRPGSKVIGTRTLSGNGTVVFKTVCAGNFFLAFGTPDSNQVNVTQYFKVTNNGNSYSNPVITAFYTVSRVEGNRTSTSKRSDL
jgi:hypothetical protein